MIIELLHRNSFFLRDLGIGLGRRFFNFPEPVQDVITHLHKGMTDSDRGHILDRGFSHNTHPNMVFIPTGDPGIPSCRPLSRILVKMSTPKSRSMQPGTFKLGSASCIFDK